MSEDRILLNFPKFSEFSGRTFRIFPNFPDKLSEVFRIFRTNFPNFSEFSEFFRIFRMNLPNFSSQNRWGPFFSGLTPRTFRILLNFPNFFRIFRMSFPNFPDELSEFCWNFLIFHPKTGGDLFFFFLGLTPLNFPNLSQLSEFSGRTFRILFNFPNFFQIFRMSFPNFLTTFRILVYFPNSGLLSEFWPKMDQEPGS